jgi:hypothetical protein
MKVTYIPFLMLVSSICFSCGRASQKAVSVDTKSAKQEETLGIPTAESPSSNVILGRVVSMWIDAANESAIEACKLNPCEAKVEILAVEQRGSLGYNALEAGTILPGYFEFTLSSTQYIFPELNHHLPGLKEGDIFRSEVQLSEDGTLTIGRYLKIE